MSDDALKAPTKDALIIAAIRLVDAIVEYRRPTNPRPSTVPKREAEAKKSGFELISYAQLHNTPDEVVRARDIVKDPVVWSLKKGLRELGKLLYEAVGSTDELLKVAEFIASRDDDRYQSRMSPIDSAWDGIGSGDDRWRS